MTEPWLNVPHATDEALPGPQTWRDTSPEIPPDPAHLTPRRVGLRLLPFLALLYVIAYLDRANVAFAGSALRAGLGLSEALFGFGTGIFFVGYLFLQIPGAIVVARWGARRWIALILLSWGGVTALVGCAHTPAQFVGARFLLGLTEAGFLPGVIVYISQWFRRRDRARAMACFIIAQPVAMALGSPISSAVLQVHWMGISAWRWLFILEGLPAIVCGVLTWYLLTDRPEDAEWLSQESRLWLVRELEIEAAEHPQSRPLPWWAALGEFRVLLLTAAYFFGNVAGSGFTLWLPSILESQPHVAAAAGVTGAMRSLLPFVFGVLGAVAIGWLSDKRLQLARYASTCLFGSGLFLLLSVSATRSSSVAFFFFCCTGFMAYAWIAPFWVLPTLLLRDEAAAGAIGLINAVGSLGGFVGVYLIGWLLTSGWSYPSAIVWLSLSYGFAAVLTYLAAHGKQAVRPAQHARL
jgi:ACS family tartrate transporter-like MFS transporter